MNKLSWFWKLAPGPIRKLRRYLRDKRVAEIFKPLSNAEVFDKIYADELWGQGQENALYSGEGSHSEDVVNPYVQSVNKFIESTPDLHIAADLGCGDFHIGSRICHLFRAFHAIDVSSLVIGQNKNMFKQSGLKFHNLSITSDEMPPADVAFVRQVLQHLSNNDIQRFLNNIKGKYRYLIITESLSSSPRFIANKDIVTEPGIRIHKKSGVDITLPPFNYEVLHHREICRVNVGKETIVTTVYTLP